MNGKKLHGLETKRKITESADSLFREYGFENVSVESIVERAGIAKGSFYVHFDTKDALTAVLIAEYVKQSELSYEAFIEAFPGWPGRSMRTTPTRWRRSAWTRTGWT